MYKVLKFYAQGPTVILAATYRSGRLGAVALSLALASGVWPALAQIPNDKQDPGSTNATTAPLRGLIPPTPINSSTAPANHLQNVGPASLQGGSPNLHPPISTGPTSAAQPAGVTNQFQGAGGSYGRPRVEPNTASAIRPEDGDGTVDDPSAAKILGGDEQIVIKKPRLEALVSVSKSLNPYALDSEKSEGINLTDVLKTTVARNLDISIADLDRRVGKSNFWGSVGKFLPDINLGYNYQYLKGKAGIPFGATPGPINLDTPFIIASAAFNYHVYRGGSVLYGALQRSNLYKAAKYSQRTTISDSLLNTTRLYYDLVLNEALLQIRIRAVEVSKAQLQISQNLVNSGRGTNLDLFQSETQLSSDTQNLIDQQVARRVAAIRLADFLNADQGIDLVPVDTLIATKRLISDRMTVPNIVNLAVENRPELKDRKEQALAQKKQVIIASAPLQPKLDFIGTAYGIGETLSHNTTTSYIYNPNGNGSILTEHGQRQIANLYSLGLNATWNFGALGTVDAANIYTAKLQTREAYLRLDRERNTVIDQARVAYLNSLSAARKLEEANKQVRSATEELRLSRLRFENGLSKNIDVLRAQQDFTNSLILKAQAIINYNIAQAQLVHDIGLTSVETLTRAVPEGS
ncbi:MAG: TolC family protein [Cyanobacteria bacterium REEB67]|nr:TolC family protein [Cyanobacteria bacterium REEB67]